MEQSSPPITWINVCTNCSLRLLFAFIIFVSVNIQVSYFCNKLLTITNRIGLIVTP